MVRIHSSNENDAVQMADVFARLRKITRSGISVMVTHHNNKKSNNTEQYGQDMRGSSDILASVDCHISIKRDRNSNSLTITQSKIRLAQELAPIEVRVNSGEEVTFEYTGQLEVQTSVRTRLRSSVVDVLGIHVELNKKDLAGLIEEKYSKVNLKTLRSVLDMMISEELINERAGKGKEKLYALRGKKETPKA